MRWLGKIRGTARARYRDDRLDLSGCGEKVRQLIADAVVADGIEILVKEVQLFSPEFDEKVEALESDEAKASEMEHAIRHEINVRVEENPAFYQSLRQRLEEIIEQRRAERVDAAQQLSLLNSLREELKGEQTQAQDIGLDARGFAIYGLLKEGRPIQAGEKTATYNAANLGGYAPDVRHPPQRPEEEDRGGDRGPRWRGVARGPGAVQHQQARRDGQAEGTVDRSAAPGGGVRGPAAVAPRVRQRRERAVPGAPLPHEG